MSGSGPVSDYATVPKTDSAECESSSRMFSLSTAAFPVLMGLHELLKNGAFDGRGKIYPDYSAILDRYKELLLEAMGSRRAVSF
jgi:hypothetical protein